jgi:RNA polymerase-binding transcription factor DksA
LSNALNRQKITINSSCEYFKNLESHEVIADHKKRKQIIANQISQITTENNLIAIDNEDSSLLNEVVGMCEKCGIRLGKEVHHMQYQKDADINSGLIINCDGIMHKNNIANLLTICEECHDEIHRNNTKLKKVKTTKGSNLKTI